MKFKLGLKSDTYTYKLGKLPVAKIHDQINYGIDYGLNGNNPKQADHHNAHIQLYGCNKMLETLEEAVKELQDVVGDKFQHLSMTVENYSEVREVEI